MNNQLIDILIVIFSIALFFSVAFNKSFNDDYFSKETSKSLKGMCSIIVLFHHISQNTTTGIIIRQFEGVGYLAVAVFFFITGYGLCKNYFQNKYQKGFIKKHMIPIMLQYCFIIVAYAIFYYFFLGEPLKLNYLLLHLLDNYSIINFSWYLVNLIWFYIVYYVSIIFSKKSIKRLLLINFIGYLIYLLFCIRTNKSDFWYKSSHLLLIGIAYSYFETNIIAILKKYYYVFVGIDFFGLLILLKLFPIFSKSTLSVIIYYIIITVMFVLLIILFIMKFSFKRSLFGYLGNISLELLLYQWFFLWGIKRYFPYFSEIKYSILVIIFSCLLGFIMHAIIVKVNNKILNAISKN